MYEMLLGGTVRKAPMPFQPILCPVIGLHRSHLRFAGLLVLSFITVQQFSSNMARISLSSNGESRKAVTAHPCFGTSTRDVFLVSPKTSYPPIITYTITYIRYLLSRRYVAHIMPLILTTIPININSIDSNLSSVHRLNNLLRGHNTMLHGSSFG